MNPVRFGIFEFDPVDGTLNRDGRQVRLGAQPAKALGMLLQAGGEVVTREALRDAIWGAETHVDFDRGLNFCISQIRAALGDSAESPRYIATVPRSGYRFIAPIHSEPEQTTVPRRRPVAIGALAAILLALAVPLYRASQPDPTPQAVAVARFDNETGDASLDPLADGITDSLVAALVAAGQQHVIGNAAVLRERPPACGISMSSLRGSKRNSLSWDSYSVTATGSGSSHTSSASRTSIT